MFLSTPAGCSHLYIMFMYSEMVFQIINYARNVASFCYFWDICRFVHSLNIFLATFKCMFVQIPIYVESDCGFKSCYFKGLRFYFDYLFDDLTLCRAFQEFLRIQISSLILCYLFVALTLCRFIGFHVHFVVIVRGGKYIFLHMLFIIFWIIKFGFAFSNFYMVNVWVFLVATFM